MAKHKHRLTVIVVPQTAKRPYTFTFAPAWLTALAVLITGLGVGVWHYYDVAQELRSELRTDLAELEDLRRTNRLQQDEIEKMYDAARTVQERLAEVELLEQQIRSLTGEETAVPSRSGDSRSATTLPPARGGPATDRYQQQNLPILGSLLPPDLEPYVLGRRETVQLDLRLGRVAANADQSLETAHLARSVLNNQATSLERTREALGEGREEITAQLEYLAHRPTGWPIYGATISDRFGSRWSPFGWGQQHHDGLDLAHNYWEPIYATAKGQVSHAGWKAGGFGNTVIIEHGYGLTTLYAHMVDWNVEYGEEVERGTVIGWVGNTGLSTGPHLHYEVHLNGIPVDPANYLE